MRREQQITQEIEELHETILLLNKERNRIRSKKLWQCHACERKTGIGKLLLVIPHEWVSGCGYEDGYYCKPSEYLIKCPKCNIVNRICNTFVQSPPFYNNITLTDVQYKFITEYKNNFGEVFDWYKSNDNTTFNFDTKEEEQK